MSPLFGPEFVFFGDRQQLVGSGTTSWKPDAVRASRFCTSTWTNLRFLYGGPPKQALLESRRMDM